METRSGSSKRGTGHLSFPTWASVLSTYRLWFGRELVGSGHPFDESRKVRRRAPGAEIGVVLASGAFAAVFGLLGTLVGMAQVFGSIARAGIPVEPTLILGGLQASLVTCIFGLCVFALSLLAWFALRALTRGA